ncbi:MAG: DNA polymerase III subunit chi [Gammaproteobacteria bacterium]|nr:DNA polymerase III subunit chi [Gammaproteobacteria bacterium]
MKIDFYVTSALEKNGLFRFVCRIVEKAYQQGCRVYIHTENASDAQQMDTALWTFHDVSFVPHSLVSENKPAPVMVGFLEKLPASTEVLINLSATVPMFYDRFQRIIEIVSEDPIQKSKAREHYRRYKANGFEIDVHNIS